MAEPVDLWHVKSPRAGAGECAEHRLYPGTKHGRGRRWAARYRDHNGKQCSPTFARKTEAKAHLVKVEGELARGAYVNPQGGKTKFRDQAAHWRSIQTFDAPTRERAESQIRLHLVPHLGELELRAIKPSTVQALSRKLQGRLEASTIHIILGWLSSILQAAVDDGLIGTNPCSAKSIKRPAKPVKKVVPWTAARADAMRSAIRTWNPSCVEIVTMGEGLGLRIGEILGFSPDDFDVEREIAHVRRQVRIVANKLVFALPKGRKERDVPLPRSVYDRMSAHLAQHPAKPVTLPWTEPEGRPRTVALAFTHPDGGAWRRATLNMAVWQPALKLAEIPTGDRLNGAHALRHRFASLVLAGGATVRDLADWLGHVDPGFTLRTYAHLLPSSADKMRAAIDAELAKPI